MIARTTPLAPALYLVATPIGNARDITLRALDVLASADVLAAEDTRTLRKIMDIHGLSVGDRPLLAYHDHSSDAARQAVIGHIKQGRSVAYASEAGTPLVADPGYRLATEARSDGLTVTALPGPSAVLAALTVSGLPSDRFTFAGFAPSAATARRKFLVGLSSEAGTLVFYESPKRLEKFLADAVEVFGGDCPSAICRELTKKFETVTTGRLADLRQAPGTLKGEFVIVIGPRPEPEGITQDELDAVLRDAMTRMSVKDAAAEVAVAHGLKRRDVYQRALDLKSG